MILVYNAVDNKQFGSKWYCSVFRNFVKKELN